MKKLKYAGLGLAAAALLVAVPAFAADTAAPGAQKPSVSESLKAKASNAVEQTKNKADKAADKLQDALGARQDAAAQEKAARTEKDLNKTAASGTEVVDVDQQTVTVETPKGVEQETVITVTPEGRQPTAKTSR